VRNGKPVLGKGAASAEIVRECNMANKSSRQKSATAETPVSKNQICGRVGQNAARVGLDQL
jgi:hypothetical protein